MLLKCLSVALCAFFIMGFFVIYNLSLFDQQLDAIMKSYGEIDLNDYVSKPMKLQQPNIPTIIIIKEMGLPRFRSRQGKNFRHHKHPRHHHTYSSEFRDYMTGDRVFPHELYPTKAFERTREFLKLNNDRVHKDLPSQKKTFWEVPEGNKAQEVIRTNNVIEKASDDKTFWEMPQGNNVQNVIRDNKEEKEFKLPIFHISEKTKDIFRKRFLNITKNTKLGNKQLPIRSGPANDNYAYEFDETIAEFKPRMNKDFNEAFVAHKAQKEKNYFNLKRADQQKEKQKHQKLPQYDFQYDIKDMNTPYAPSKYDYDFKSNY